MQKDTVYACECLCVTVMCVLMVQMSCNSERLFLCMCVWYNQAHMTHTRTNTCTIWPVQLFARLPLPGENTLSPSPASFTLPVICLWCDVSVCLPNTVWLQGPTRASCPQAKPWLDEPEPDSFLTFLTYIITPCDVFSNFSQPGWNVGCLPNLTVCDSGL